MTLRFVSGERSTFAALANSIPELTLLTPRTELPGCQLFVHLNWVVSRRHFCKTFAVLNQETSNQHSAALVCVLSFQPLDTSTSNNESHHQRDASFYNERIENIFAQFEAVGLVMQETELGTIMTADSKALEAAAAVDSTFLSPSPVCLPVPDGDYDEYISALRVNINLQRLGVSEVAASWEQPAAATVERFRNLFGIPPTVVSESIPFEEVVFSLTRTVQSALFLLGLLPEDYMDGLLCDATAEALHRFHCDFGLFDAADLDSAPKDWWSWWRRFCNADVLSALLNIVSSLQDKLFGNADGVKPFNVDLSTVCGLIVRFQRSHRLPVTGIFDLSTRRRLHSLRDSSTTIEQEFSNEIVMRHDIFYFVDAALSCMDLSNIPHYSRRQARTSRRSRKKTGHHKFSPSTSSLSSRSPSPPSGPSTRLNSIGTASIGTAVHVLKFTKNIMGSTSRTLEGIAAKGKSAVTRGVKSGMRTFAFERTGSRGREGKGFGGREGVDDEGGDSVARSSSDRNPAHTRVSPSKQHRRLDPYARQGDRHIRLPKNHEPHQEHFDHPEVDDDDSWEDESEYDEDDITDEGELYADQDFDEEVQEEEDDMSGSAYDEDGFDEDRSSISGGENDYTDDFDEQGSEGANDFNSDGDDNSDGVYRRGEKDGSARRRESNHRQSHPHPSQHDLMYARLKGDNGWTDGSDHEEQHRGIDSERPQQRRTRTEEQSNPPTDDASLELDAQPRGWSSRGALSSWIKTKHTDGSVLPRTQTQSPHSMGHHPPDEDHLSVSEDESKAFSGHEEGTGQNQGRRASAPERTIQMSRPRVVRSAETRTAKRQDSMIAHYQPPDSNNNSDATSGQDERPRRRKSPNHKSRSRRLEATDISTDEGGMLSASERGRRKSTASEKNKTKHIPLINHLPPQVAQELKAMQSHIKQLEDLLGPIDTPTTTTTNNETDTPPLGLLTQQSTESSSHIHHLQSELETREQETTKIKENYETMMKLQATLSAQVEVLEDMTSRTKYQIQVLEEKFREAEEATGGVVARL
ncbi:hypothetical protein HK102_006224, partial [Quaeritorhiza haematococci]